MRSTSLTALALVAVTTLVASAVAAEAATHKRGVRAAKPEAAKPFNSVGRVPGDALGIRANAADPSGTYAGYPDWARAALGSGRR